MPALLNKPQIHVADKFFGNDGDEQFKLDDKFVESYKNKKVNFGFNGLGEFVFYRTYSRVKKDGTKETFLDTIRRVVEGCYEIQRRHCNRLHIPWDYDKALISAYEMFQRIWDFKFLPSGRGLWMMGTEFMWSRGSAALCSCAFVSTDQIEADPAEPFCFLMDMSMLGVGVGFDLKGAGKINVYKPACNINTYVVNDSREGWVDSIRTLIHSYTTKWEEGQIEFDYSPIRKAGSDIKGFGGKASGPDNLERLHEMISNHFAKRIGKTLSSVDIADIMNYIGKCVVAGNVRRSSEIVFGDPDDTDYMTMKNATKTLKDEDLREWYRVTTKLYKDFGDDTPIAYIKDFENSDSKYNIPHDRLIPAIETWNSLNNHRWASNNSILAKVGMNYDWISNQIAVNGEPGFLWLDSVQDYGRMVDGRKPGIDGRVRGSNPCGEQSLESYECCNLCELFPAHHEDAEDFLRTIKYAYLYSKTVTLLPTHNARANQVMLRNRRIGLSQSGIVQAFEKFGRRTVLRDFCDAGYNEVKRWDEVYSEWLCVQQSIKVTSVKPSGSVSLLAGSTSGIHHPETKTYWRRVRIAKDSILIKILRDAGYHIEPAVTDNKTMVVKFAISDERIRSIDQVSIWEQMTNAVDYQKYWTDNQVSCTIKFKKSEIQEIPRVLEAFEDQLKGISFLPLEDHGYAQAPYESCSLEEVIEYNKKIKPVDYSSYINEAVGVQYCDGETCSPY